MTRHDTKRRVKKEIYGEKINEMTQKNQTLEIRNSPGSGVSCKCLVSVVKPTLGRLVIPSRLGSTSTSATSVWSIQTKFLWPNTTLPIKTIPTLKNPPSSP
jgi:ABC-type antimicrobial peptide transport system ATPase subunit